MKKLFAIIFSLTFILTACGGEDSGKTDDQVQDEQETNSLTEAQSGDLLASIQEAGELKIGTEGTYPPFTFHDESGELTGFDVEIAREVAIRLGVEPVFLETQWDAMFAGLDAKRFDMIANQVGIRPDREEKYSFSDPYISSSAVLVTQKDNDKVTSFEDISGLKAAQSLTSNYADIAKEHGAEVTGVEGFNQAIELLSSKRVDVTINDKLSVLDFLKQKPDAPIKIAATSEDAAQSGLMFRQGNDQLVQEVNKALAEMKEDGTYLEISEKWFGEDVSK
ncbi:cystine transport system substrate-binding protein [Bacillus mesophilus]|uniref:Amino acid ABC transporter substrate-binding protein n=1 Tax=Bacillus mesophilus TaxID=1808955 RepID=A0A6M0Q893_9BACI|nr:amino acid ABC transporter substrate-binding protein [Bacillus mesophilus]MBM7662064.1 cystine transport system substrate-binding protein [Bacillus mesophilus]NEY72581.1 amino acid ABC transporter substrate-binding protein [Bacillus mesophilus]